MRGPKVVALGGGHGLSSTLLAVRRYAGDVTAVVSVADDGGSSGRLRTALGIPPPGDLRKCLIALGDSSSLWGRALDHRFDGGELDGHALGNLLIAGLAITSGDFITAVDEVGRLVGAVGRVLPATNSPVVLAAEAACGRVEGQVAIARTPHISRVEVCPADVEPPPAVLEAIAAADQIVIGPGSLYTSVLAVVVIPDVGDALKRTSARKVYVCNLRPQVPETEGYDLAAHLGALANHGLEVDDVVCDPSQLDVGEVGVPCHRLDLALEDGSGHDPVKLGGILATLRG
ncbi:MAG: uridine diphosphate-N-acetylglucosamine-binding protein YvcK [Actinomycetota bacterium]|nr:uridine diphosphate-N-acetylglucosamine-binding protein YvcK [Actinomycetota bacterium]